VAKKPKNRQNIIANNPEPDAFQFVLEIPSIKRSSQEKISEQQKRVKPKTL
jgi:hypothetical protein